jgi:hypothetical protein
MLDSRPVDHDCGSILNKSESTITGISTRFEESHSHCSFFIIGLQIEISQTTPLESMTSMLPSPEIFFFKFAGSLFIWFSSLKIELIRFSETSVHIRTNWRYIPEDGNIHKHRCENFKCYVENNVHYALTFCRKPNWVTYNLCLSVWRTPFVTNS